MPEYAGFKIAPSSGLGYKAQTFTHAFQLFLGAEIEKKILATVQIFGI